MSSPVNDSAFAQDTLDAIKDIHDVEVFYHNSCVGRLALDEYGCCAFQYNQEFLSKGINISPFEFELDTNSRTAEYQPFGGNFGVFADSLPDGWGSLVFDRYLRNQGVNPFTLTILQRLSLIGSTGRGALEYRPDNSLRGELRPVDFNELVKQIQNLYRAKDCDDSSNNVTDTIFRYSGSSGGARPKMFVKSEGKEWLVKFPASVDPASVGEQEYNYSLLAKSCGIVMPETRLFNGEHFGTQRFDRSEEGKIHTISAAGLLHADYRYPVLDYVSLLRACLHLTKDVREVKQLFRVMVFNVVIGNRDDHARNFSFQLIGEDWKLSPAYDLLPCFGLNGEHFTSINGSGDPNRNDLINCGLEASLDKDYMNSSIDEILDICHSENMARADLRVK